MKLEIIGKSYANRKKKAERPEGDGYHTPKSLIWVAQSFIKKEFKHPVILEPCCGHGSISQELLYSDYDVTLNDLYTASFWSKDFCASFDYLEQDYFDHYDYIITNPPFSLWNEFVEKAKMHCRKFMYLGKLNFFGTHSRNVDGLWNHLKWVLPFDRYVDYQTPYRDDGLFHVGSQSTAWFIWDMKYKDKPMIELLDVQRYARLGPFLKRKPK